MSLSAPRHAWEPGAAKIGLSTASVYPEPAEVAFQIAEVFGVPLERAFEYAAPARRGR